MKVLVVHNKYLSKNIGGEDIVFFREAQSLRDSLGAKNVFTYEVSNDELVKWKLFFTIWFSFRHYFSLRRLIKQHEIDILHVHNFFPLLTPSVFLAGRTAGIKVIHTLHNFRWWCISGILFRDSVGQCELCVAKRLPLSGIKYKCYRNSFVQSIMAQMAFSFYRFIGAMKWIDQFIVMTEFQKKKVISLGVPEDRIILKGHGIKSSRALEPELKNGFVFVGRIEKAKGIFELIEAWKDLDPKFELTVIGEGDIPSGEKAENIHFLGKKSHDETLEIVNKSKFLIHPSLVYETFGLTIVEAMSLGTPVIGFKIGTREELIEDGVTGFHAQVGSLSSTIQKADQFSNYNSMSLESQRRATLFKEETMTDQLISIYGKLNE